MNLLMVFLGIVLVQSPAASSSLSVSYGDKAARMSVEDLARLPQVKKVVHSHNVEGTYEGPLLREVPASVGAPSGEALRGPALRLIVAIDAADGYRAVFSLSEVDPGFRDSTNRHRHSARRFGRSIPQRAPFRVVVPDEARPARWVRQVTGIKVIDVKP